MSWAVKYFRCRAIGWTRDVRTFSQRHSVRIGFRRHLGIHRYICDHSGNDNLLVLFGMTALAIKKWGVKRRQIPT